MHHLGLMLCSKLMTTRIFIALQGLICRKILEPIKWKSRIPWSKTFMHSYYPFPSRRKWQSSIPAAPPSSHLYLRLCPTAHSVAAATARRHVLPPTASPGNRFCGRGGRRCVESGAGWACTAGAQSTDNEEARGFDGEAVEGGMTAGDAREGIDGDGRMGWGFFFYCGFDWRGDGDCR